jgi:manganese/zinc/iron transport system ATP- binding protein
LEEDKHLEHSAESPLAIHALNVSYQNKRVLWDVDYDVTKGALTAIVGPNGAGKSTLLKAVLGLIRSDSGIVKFWGKRLTEVRLQIGYVPQRNMVDWEFPISALEVVLMGRYGHLGWFRRPKLKDYELARYYLEVTGMADFAKAQISQLSGGQQQRVFLSRALAQEANLYFMDEPFAGVDAATETVVFSVLRKLKESGKSVVVVHHDLVTIPEYFDNVLFLNTRIIAAGEVKKTFTRENLKATYGGRLTLLDEVGRVLGNLS